VFGGHRYEKDSRFRYFGDVFVLDMETLVGPQAMTRHDTARAEYKGLVARLELACFLSQVWKEIRTQGTAPLPRYGHSATLVRHDTTCRQGTPSLPHPLPVSPARLM
jgi:hypothetical protein